MKIVLYVNSFLPGVGGREIVIHYLASSLQELGHNVRVLGPAGWVKHRKLRFPYPVHRWPTLRGRFPDQVTLAQLALDTSFWGGDIIHAHNTFPTGYACSRLQKFRKIPFVVTPHGSDVHVVPEIGFGLRLDPVIEKKIQTALVDATAVTAISKAVENSLLDAGAAPEKINLIPNGVDVARFQTPVDVDVFGWLGVPRDSKLVVTVGNFHPRKGQETLIRAMPSVLENDPSVRLVIVGIGTEKLMPIIQELKLEDNVLLTGKIPLPESVLVKNFSGPKNCSSDWVSALMQSSKLYISAGMAEGTEGLSLAILEAMAAGLPIVATRISGNVDVIEHGKNGLLVEPGDVESLADGINSVLSDNVKRLKMSNLARNVANEYEWKKIANMYVDLYKTCL